MRPIALFQAVGLFLGLTNAAPSADVSVASRDLFKRAPTCNTPSNRACWSNGFDINTDYESSIPNTGNTRRVSESFPALQPGNARAFVTVD